MSQAYRFNRLSVLLTALISVSAVAAAQGQAKPTSLIITVKIKVDDLSMVIVPVSINGSRPYDFLMDTGTAKSMIDRKLAAELGLPATEQKTVVGVMASARASVVRVNSVSIAGATVGAGELLSSDSPANVSGKVRGVLGEDFLRNFDLLLDYRQRVLCLESISDSMAQNAGGEHLPLQLEGVLQGQASYNHLVVSGNLPELDGKPMSLLLDSGTNQLIVFRQSLGAPGVSRAESVETGNFGSWKFSETATRKLRSLKIGRSSLDDLTVVGFSRRPFVDVDGLLPTSLFHTIFISYRGRFIILNPSFPKKSTRS